MMALATSRSLLSLCLLNACLLAALIMLARRDGSGGELRLPVSSRGALTCIHAGNGQSQGQLSRRGMMLGGVSAIGMIATKGAEAAGRKFPPIDPNPDRCELATGGNTIGQSNAASDRELDLRLCKLEKRDLRGKTLSGGLFQGGSFDQADFTDVVMSKAYAAEASFKNCDFSNSVLDRVIFDKSDLSGSKFTNAVITGASFEEANLSGTSFEDAVIGQQDLKRLCKNPTLPKEVAEELGC
mmetsp:Transcript_47399/g.78553  ORF Transcript_47399/g.78553 Transcript_47399/m.78553 type:complete len:241 (-) Transcript_47399:47-769(-)